MPKKVQAVSDNQTYLKNTLMAALQSDPEVKFCIDPRKMGIRASDGSMFVGFADGTQYRVDIKVSIHEPAQLEAE